MNTRYYDKGIVPLPRQMTNLDELVLNLAIFRENPSYVDGTELNHKIVRYMPYWKEFTFSLETALVRENVNTVLPSNEDIEHSFIDSKYGQVSANVEVISAETGYGRCHIYSLPYTFPLFDYVSNTFSGGIFNKVQRLVMKDLNSLECSLHKTVSQCFPFLVELYIRNSQSQKNKESSTTPIIFPHLLYLGLLGVTHEDYAEQFLVYNQCHLPRLVRFEINYGILVKVTKNFINDATRQTGAQLTNLIIEEMFVRPENFNKYLSLL